VALVQLVNGARRGQRAEVEQHHGGRVLLDRIPYLAERDVARDQLQVLVLRDELAQPDLHEILELGRDDGYCPPHGAEVYRPGGMQG
jgi:hypothetical protein